MRISPENVLSVTAALRQKKTTLAALEAITPPKSRAEVEALVELLADPPSAKAATLAVSALELCDDSIVIDGLLDALDCPYAWSRIAAIQGLQQRSVTRAKDRLTHILKCEGSWIVRRAALEALASFPEPDRWQILSARDDPHWRVRHALIRHLTQWGEDDTERDWIERRLLAGAEENVIVKGVWRWLQFAWHDQDPEAFPSPPPDPRHEQDFWDWDPAVLARNLTELDTDEQMRALDLITPLLGHGDERVRGAVVEILNTHGEANHFAEAIRLLDEPRLGVRADVFRCVDERNADRLEDVSRLILTLDNPSPAQLSWALDQLEDVYPTSEVAEQIEPLMENCAHFTSEVRAALVRLAGRWRHSCSEGVLLQALHEEDPRIQCEALRELVEGNFPIDINDVTRFLQSDCEDVRAEAVSLTTDRHCDIGLLESLVHDPSKKVRLRLAESLAQREGMESLLNQLQSDEHPHVRAAALTESRAKQLIENPERETSWHVLARAARMCKTPLWNLEPEKRWQPTPAPISEQETLHPQRCEPPRARALGPHQWQVAPLGISGHYGLPVEGFVRAMESGVNLMFWEPNYDTMTRFVTRLNVPDRESLYLIAGTFEAEPKKIRRDVERVLRSLKLESLPLFMLFWTRSWRRLSTEVRHELEQLQQQGKIQHWSLSTHHRPLALEAMDEGWNPLMVRHSAAHKGAEREIFPKAVETKTNLIAFNCTCYARLLRVKEGRSPPRIADCYRYSLSQPGVVACLSAPATLEQLEENLTVLDTMELTPDRRSHLEQHGDWLYRDETIFRKLVREL